MSDTSEARAEARKAAEGKAAERFMDGVIERLGGRSGVQAVFGDPIERGSTTVVPVARVRWFFGGGSGSGPMEEGQETAGGSGGGGGASGDPVGYLEIGPSGALFQPIVPPYPSPFFILAAGFTAALVIRALARLLRG